MDGGGRVEVKRRRKRERGRDEGILREMVGREKRCVIEGFEWVFYMCFWCD